MTRVLTGAVWIWTRAGGVWTQQGPKLIGSGGEGQTYQGSSVSLSSDGNTAIVGGFGDSNEAGAVWLWTRKDGVWSQQGPKLVGADAQATARQGWSVSLSGDGNTAIVGELPFSSSYGAVWVYTRSDGVWMQQGPKLVGSGADPHDAQGRFVALSGDGNTAIVGWPYDSNGAGAAWVWTRSAGIWTQQGTKLVGSDTVAVAFQGTSLALSADGNTAIVGGSRDDADVGAAWIWTRSGEAWTQQGDKVVGTGALGRAWQGFAVALSADGNTGIVGGPFDNDLLGAAWVWTRSGGAWTQQGPKLLGSGAVPGAYNVQQGSSVALSADGDTAIVGGPADGPPGNDVGAAWVWTRSGGAWTQQGPKLVGTGGVGQSRQGTSVALSADGNTALVGGYADDNFSGAVWVWTRTGGVWTQHGPKLVGSGAIQCADLGGAGAGQGYSVSLSADGNTALVGAFIDNCNKGAAWVWSRAGGIWTQQGPKLLASDTARGSTDQGASVSLSADGNTAVVGGPGNNDGVNLVGAAWVWTRSGGVWTQLGPKVVGTGAIGSAQQGVSVALSGDGKTLVTGGPGDNGGVGAAWVFLAAPLAASFELGPVRIFV